MRVSTFGSMLAVLFLASAALGDDWPQWLGPKRDSVWREEGIVERFPKSGLKVKWRKPVALGYAGPAVAGGKVYVSDYLLKKGKVSNVPSKRDELEGLERVLCFDAKTGEQLWKHEEPRTYNISYPSGPRATPTVAGNKVYVLGAEGNLLCLSADKGKVIWSKDFKKEYGAETPIWGFTAHPLVHGDLVYCIVGGKDSVAVAFDKDSGKEVWKNLSAYEQGYCPPTLIEHGGKEQLLIWHPEAINSLNPKTGAIYWSVPLKPDYAMSITAPRLFGDQLYVSGYKNAALMLKLGNGNPKILWSSKPKFGIACDNSTPILEDGVMYGVDGNSGALTAANIKDGKRLWETRKPTNDMEGRLDHGTAFLFKHKDRFFLFSETGDLILAKLSPQKYEELDRFHVLEPTNSTFGRKVVWSCPAFAEKCLFARNDQELVCVSLASE